MRHTIAYLLAVLLASSSFASDPSCPPAPETAWLCKSRIGGWVPRVGRLYHSSVIFCPPGVMPYAVDAEGRVISNPDCPSYGTQPKHDHFLREDKPRIGATFEMSPLPPEEVRERIMGFSRRWRWWYNCQHAAREVTGN